ncbi:hypothetical protein HK104_008161, partial [Borealophlyctis nickersoniae]
MKPTDRAVLTRVVDVMCGMGVRFLQERGEEGVWGYKLDPPIDTLTTFTGVSHGGAGKRLVNAPYAVKQMVAQE